MNKSIIDELTRIRKGYKPVSKAWYYKILYDICALISIIKMSIKHMRKPNLRYKCPNCGKESDDSQVVFDCIYDHEYNKNKTDNKKEEK